MYGELVASGQKSLPPEPLMVQAVLDPAFERDERGCWLNSLRKMEQGTGVTFTFSLRIGLKKSLGESVRLCFCSWVVVVVVAAAAAPYNFEMLNVYV